MRFGRMLVVLVVTLVAAKSATGAGFRLPEAGAKAMGMGFAFTAQADDPSAIYFNPAGLTQLEGQNVMVGGTYIRENGAEFSGETPLTLLDPTLPKAETQKDLDFFVPNAYWTRRATENLAYGVGLFVPFGLAQEYQNRETSIFRNQVTEIELQTFVVNPTIAYKFNEYVSAGVGIDFMYGKAKLAQTGVVPVAPPFNIFLLDLEGDGTAWGYNAGILVTPTKRWKLGISYRSGFELDIDDADVEVRNINGTIPFVPNPTPPPAALTAQQIFGGAAFDTKGSTTIDMPATFGAGIAYAGDRLTVEVDADVTFWSSFETLVIDIRDNSPLLPDAVRPEDWDDVVAFRAGVEYRVTAPLALRAGFAYDPTPVPSETMSPLLPDADRFQYSAGLGYKVGSWTLDFAYLYVDKDDRTVDNLNDGRTDVNNFAGTWKGDAHLVALDVGYRF